MINGKTLRNMGAIPYMTQMMPPVKELVAFKLNTDSPSGFFTCLSWNQESSSFSLAKTQQHYGEKYNNSLLNRAAAGV